MVCTDFFQPLSLDCGLLNTFAETNYIFLFGALMLIASMAAYFGMSGLTTLIVITFFVFVMSTFIDTSALTLLIAIILPLIIYSMLSRVVKR